MKVAVPTRRRPVRPRSWHRCLSLLLLLGIGLSSVEIVWGDAWVDGDGDAEFVSVGADDAAPQAPDGPEAPLRHAGHDTDCPCLCACLCAGATGAILPTLAFAEALVEAAFHPVIAPERVPASIAPAPLLRPPLA